MSLQGITSRLLVTRCDINPLSPRTRTRIFRDSGAFDPAYPACVKFGEALHQSACIHAKIRHICTSAAIRHGDAPLCLVTGYEKNCCLGREKSLESSWVGVRMPQHDIFRNNSGQGGNRLLSGPVMFFAIS